MSESERAQGEGSDPTRDGREGAMPRRCQWCSAEAPAQATHCPGCGASLAERETLGGMVIPGVTNVDPALAHDRSALQGVMAMQRNSTAIAVRSASMRGMPVGMGLGIAAAAAVAYGVARLTEEKPQEPEVGATSGAALELAGRLDRGEEIPGVTEGSVAVGPADAVGAAPADANGTPAIPDPWFDLPPAASESLAGTQNDPWATGKGPWSDDPWEEGSGPSVDEASGSNPPRGRP